MGACPVIVSLALFLGFMFIQCMRYITALIIFKKKLKISPLLLKFVLMTYRAAVYFTTMILLYKPLYIMLFIFTLLQISSFELPIIRVAMAVIRKTKNN